MFFKERYVKEILYCIRANQRNWANQSLNIIFGHYNLINLLDPIAIIVANSDMHGSGVNFSRYLRSVRRLHSYISFPFNFGIFQWS